MNEYCANCGHQVTHEKERIETCPECQAPMSCHVIRLLQETVAVLQKDKQMLVDALKLCDDIVNSETITKDEIHTRLDEIAPLSDH